MPRLLGLYSVLIASLLAVTPARADVSWDFIVTSAVNLGCSTCAFDPRPALGGTLTVSDAAFLRGSVDYLYSNGYYEFPPTDITRDTDFEIDMGSALPLPIYPWALEQLFYTDVVLSFSPKGKISGYIEFLTWYDLVRMDIANNIVTDAYYASDGTIPGCGENTQCRISGYWKLTSGHPLPHRVPEPSALSILVGAITGLGILGQRVVLQRQRIA